MCLLAVIAVILNMVVALDFDDEDFAARIKEFDKGLPPIGGYKGDADDIPYILCDSCKILVNKTIKATYKLRKKMNKKELRKRDVDGVLSNRCNTKHSRGKWISRYDLDESKPNEITLIKHKSYGKCKSECRTIGLACAKVEEAAKDVIVNMLIKYQDSLPTASENIIKIVCGHELEHIKGGCNNRIEIPKDRVKFDEEFEEKTSQDEFMDSLNEQLRNGNFKTDL